MVGSKAKSLLTAVCYVPADTGSGEHSLICSIAGLTRVSPEGRRTGSEPLRCRARGVNDIRPTVPL